MMCIAIYIGTLPAKKEQWNTADWLSYEVVSRFLSVHDKERYLLLSDEPVQAFFPENEKIEHLVLGKFTPRILSMYRRFNYKLPAAMKHAGSRLLVSLPGVLPLRHKDPSCLLLSDDIVTVQKPALREGFKRYRSRYLSRCLRQAGQIITLSESTKKQIMSRYQVPEHQISVVRRGVPEMFKPLRWETREEVKTQYADGKEYLLYAGDITKESNVIALLKAFSILKKKMHSGMVLVLAGRQDPAFKKFPELLRTYHFKKDVKLTGALPMAEIARLTGAAYARIVPSAGTGFCSPVPEALHCRTPVIAANSALHEEDGGEAILYCDPEDFNAMGEQLCALYKNEELRAQLIARSEEQAKGFSWNKTADLFWEALLRAEQSPTKK